MVEYIKNKSKVQSNETEEKNKNKEKKKEEKKQNGIKIKARPSLIFVKLCAFDCIQKIMDPHMKPLNKYFEQKWK